VFPRKVRFLHDGLEFFLVDGGREAGSRILTLLRRCEDPPPEGAVLVTTDLGPCESVAVWRDGAIELESRFEELREPFEKLVTRYLSEFRTGRPRPGAEPYYFLTIDNAPLFELTMALPYGLSVLIYTEQKAAENAATLRSGTGGRAIVVEQTGDLADFLEARIAEGFAGAWLDERDPVFPCRDSAGHPRFLRVSLSGTDGEIEHHLLEDGGRFRTYEGQEDIETEIDIDVDRHDEFMRERLGDIPFLGYFEGIRFHRPASPAAPNDPVFVQCDEDCEGEVVAPIFHDLELGQAFLDEHGLQDHSLETIDDLSAFVADVERRGRVVRIQPGTHRARGGLSWSARGELYLDTFSGLWAARDGVGFARVDS